MPKPKPEASITNTKSVSQKPAYLKHGSKITPKTIKSANKKKRKSSVISQRDRIKASAAPLHDRRKRLVSARETTLRDLGGLMLEMYKRNRFREELLLDKCEEILAVEVEIAHVDQRLFQLAPPNAAGMRPIGRCECGSPIHPGQNFCGVCGRSFATLTQSRSCHKCGTGIRPGDQYCSSCGAEVVDETPLIETGSAPPLTGQQVAASTLATSAVEQTIIIEPPALDDAVIEAKETPVAGGSVSNANDGEARDNKGDEAATASVESIPTAPFEWSSTQSNETAIDAALSTLQDTPPIDVFSEQTPVESTINLEEQNAPPLKSEEPLRKQPQPVDDPRTKKLNAAEEKKRRAEEKKRIAAEKKQAAAEEKAKRKALKAHAKAQVKAAKLARKSGDSK